MIHTLAAAAMAITLSHAPRKSEIPRLRPRTGPPARWAIHLVKRSTGKTFPVPFNLSRVRLERLPLVAEKDVRSYHWATHRLVLRKSTLRRLKRIRRSLVGRRFVVVVGKNRLYAGTIATPLWSKSMSTPVILFARTGLVIQHGYPTDRYGRGPDPRSHSKVRSAFKRLRRIR